MIIQPIKGLRHLLGIGCGEGRQWWRVGEVAVCDQCGVRVEGAGRECLTWVTIDFLAGEEFIDATAEPLFDDRKVEIGVVHGATRLLIHGGRQ